VKVSYFPFSKFVEKSMGYMENSIYSIMKGFTCYCGSTWRQTGNATTTSGGILISDFSIIRDTVYGIYDSVHL
jgi:hypothetical protein